MIEAHLLHSSLYPQVSALVVLEEAEVARRTPVLLPLSKAAAAGDKAVKPRLLEDLCNTVVEPVQTPAERHIVAEQAAVAVEGAAE